MIKSLMSTSVWEGRFMGLVILNITMLAVFLLVPELGILQVMVIAQLVYLIASNYGRSRIESLESEIQELKTAMVNLKSSSQQTTEV